MEPSQYKERNEMEENFSDLRVSDQAKEDDDVCLSRIRVNVRRPDSSIAEGVSLGRFLNAIVFVICVTYENHRRGVSEIFERHLPRFQQENGDCTHQLSLQSWKSAWDTKQSKTN